MADVTSIRSDTIPGQMARGVQVLKKSYSLAADLADNGDTIALFTVPVGAKWDIVGAKMAVSATLGASATVRLRANRAGSATNLTAATTAGGASVVTDAAQSTVPFSAQGGDVIELLVGGADFSGAATADVTLFYRPR